LKTEAHKGLFKLQITRLQNYSISSDSRTSHIKHAGIQLHSSQNNNVVLFFVVRLAFQDETNLLIKKHLQPVFQISTDAFVEKSAIPGSFIAEL
jgi:hypothetical protein